MKVFLRLVRYGFVATLVLGLLGAGAITAAWYYISPDLPPTDTLKDVRLQVPLRIYSRDGKLIAEYGEIRRTPLPFEDIPEPMVQALIAAEDDRFFEHPGVDYQGIIRAAVHLIRTGEKGQGGSTITMQLARNFFLSSQKTYLRKLQEIFLALKIEQELTKQEILGLYLNKIYLGQRAYGVAAAAQVYYGVPLDELDIPQFAMIAGLPKAPSRYNPVVNSSRATLRRDYVLRRMHELGFISPEQYQEYISAPVTARLHTTRAQVDAPYLAEMVRAEMVARFGRDAYTAGYRVYTTVESRLQRAANRAVRNALLEYHRRHGYRGPEGHIELNGETDPEQWQAALSDYSPAAGLFPALVVAVDEKSASVVLAGMEEPIELDWEGMAWARPYLSDFSMGPEPKTAGDVLKVGDIIRLESLPEGRWRLAETPEAAGALISLQPDDGAVLALVGGFDYYQSKFNRVTQAERQPGSNFKPFIYSAALANGFTPASIINDAPVVFEDSTLEAEWRPENYSGRFYGPTRLREALVQSRNLVSIRLLRSMGVPAALHHASRFGFDPDRLNHDLSMALGSSALTPLELVRGYAVLANGGFLVSPYFIDRIEDADGELLMQADPLIACLPCEDGEIPPHLLERPRPSGDRDEAEEGESNEAAATAEPEATVQEEAEAVDAGNAESDGEEEPETAWEPRLAERTVDVRNIYLVTSMLQDVIKRGTGRRALALRRNDLAGKTGTTNDQHDAWFSGFNRDVVTTAWVGFDTPRPLGAYETGAKAALPMWIEYMEVALEGRPEHALQQPPGLATVRIDPESGLLARAADQGIFETFRDEEVPEQLAEPAVMDGNGPDGGSGTLTEQLF